MLKNEKSERFPGRSLLILRRRGSGAGTRKRFQVPAHSQLRDGVLSLTAVRSWGFPTTWMGLEENFQSLLIRILTVDNLMLAKRPRAEKQDSFM